jgi:hypothetical protein
VRTRRLDPRELAAARPEDLAGAVLLAAVRLASGSLPKGARLDGVSARAVIAAAADAALTIPVRVAWPDPDELLEDEAAERLARAAGGAGVELRPARQGRIDLAATWDGVLHVRAEPLRRVNAIDPLEVFTLYHGQAVERGQVVAAVKVAPHLLPAGPVTAGVQLARREGPLIEVRPYRPMAVAAIAAEAISPEALARFEGGARAKIRALGAAFEGTSVVGDADPEAARAGLAQALAKLVRERRFPVLLVGGVSAGDPIAPFFAALEELGGVVVRRGVPAHPGSMIWLARLDRTQLLGLPQCGMFSMATAADLVLPRLLTGETLGAESLAELGHGGLLTREMRFRFPRYAQNLEAPEG